jgi:uncharacterized protein YjbI with pentapeptide repeats
VNLNPETQRAFPLRKISQEEMDKIVNLHKTWLLNSQQGARAVLIRTDLTGLSLIGVDLSCAIIVESDLSGVDLSRSTLRKINLTESLLYKTNFTLSNLTDANLFLAKTERAKFKGTRFED